MEIHDLPEVTKARAIRERLTELTSEIEAAAQARKKAEAEMQAAEEEAAEARALSRIEEAEAEDVDAAREALQSAQAEQEAARREEADLRRTKAILGDRLETAEQEAAEARMELLKEHLAGHVETVAGLLNELAPAMAAQKEAAMQYRDAVRAATGRTRTPALLSLDEVLSHTESAGGGAIGHTPLSRWFQTARRMGFDVELEHGHWADAA